MKPNTALALVAAALVAGNANDSIPIHPLPSFRVTGDPLVSGAKPGTVFRDKRGRSYVRDAKGTIRRVRP